jgi:hypothetical protein
MLEPLDMALAMPGERRREPEPDIPDGGADAVAAFWEAPGSSSVEAGADLRVVVELLYRLYQHSQAERHRLHAALGQARTEQAALRQALEQERAGSDRLSHALDGLQPANQVPDEVATSVQHCQTQHARRAVWRPGAEQSPVSALPGGERRLGDRQPPRASLPPPSPAPIPLQRSAPASPVGVPATGAPADAVTVQVLRVPNARTAQVLYQAVAALPTVGACSLREFGAGRLVLEVTPHAGAVLANDLRRLAAVDLRQVSGRSDALVFQLV